MAVKSRSNPLVLDEETAYTINPKILAFARLLEHQLGRRPTLHETAMAWKERRRMDELGDEPA
jgi:hypothetical protein